jgi:uncharacterized protein YecE (DUF72 family)
MPKAAGGPAGAEQRLVPEADPEALREATALSERSAKPAVVRNVLVGTAGWTDPTLIQGGLFYPSGATKSESRLRYYAEHFGLVEVDATYYTLLPAAVAEKWAKLTPPRFSFDVKSFPVLTGHPIDVGRLARDLRERFAEAGLSGRVRPSSLPPELGALLEQRFRAMLEPLLGSGKLGSVLLQYPPWFVASRGNARLIEATAERWCAVPLSVEFRHPSWLAEERRARVLELLRRHRLSLVCVDEPDDAEGSLSSVTAVTSPELAAIRMHGRNRANWRRGATVQERFNYLYGTRELESLVGRAVKLAGEAERVHVVFNNCVRNYAVLNAKGFAALLGEAMG